MKKSILVCLAILSLASMSSMAKEKIYAPLPLKILSARTVWIMGQPQSLRDQVYQELHKWGRFQVAASSQEADMIIEITYNRNSAGAYGVTDSESLTLQDSKTGESLYADSREHTTGGGAVGFFKGLHSMSASMLKELRERINEQEKQASPTGQKP